MSTEPGPDRLEFADNQSRIRLLLRILVGLSFFFYTCIMLFPKIRILTFLFCQVFG